ncbi:MULTISPECIES: hypothetical protein [Methylobacterium]|uniref:Uncharacterized protein n=1 Tax=Methylobacterium jeotgali TaxID=381630 RepID=A0ABQ4SNM0_9HYPH|nr:MULTISPECIES: hypothetical protein [Methylobacterium]PIU06682.1 MAG: hypothetical protein COT56_08620 [Methylobacterium sp. CG09_land_8_20_14_0_10_71_15]PIU12058.1 MAG: hypothetical protein COT28_16625 [Methylobacterium sp. CG08_land_8_20_14_0_20_71_15]GBU19262.1 hypothetical protein AwMethylo_34770 [Methylobacterium sp.]GJE04755.1 hypothetical protein AOPFMNJM_0047 [Methylobacterium jeotgali]
MIRRYAIFADYHQFYLWDRGAAPDTSLIFKPEDVERRIKVEDHLFVVQPERNMEVPVEIEIVSAAPDPALDPWDHVAEGSLALPSGQLEIHECTGGSIDVIDLAPDTYRVRVCFAGLDTLSEDRLDGDDRYRIVLWPAPFAGIEVLKQYVG